MPKNHYVFGRKMAAIFLKIEKSKKMPPVRTLDNTIFQVRFLAQERDFPTRSCDFRDFSEFAFKAIGQNFIFSLYYLLYVNVWIMEVWTLCTESKKLDPVPNTVLSKLTRSRPFRKMYVKNVKK